MPLFSERVSSIGMMGWMAAWWATALFANAESEGKGAVGLDVRYVDEPSPTLHLAAAQWIDHATNAVTAYYGEFPVPGALLRISLRGGHEPGHGQAFGERGPHVTISLGRDATTADLQDDWMLTHELLHLCFPSVARNHHWMEEGLSTYAESLARARAGLLTPERAWSDLFNGLPQGQPAAGDRGLDETSTWGRTYWGGALFWFRADVEIRRRTNNRFGLEHALRAIVAHGGTIEHDWPVEKVIAVGDDATGVSVLHDLYEEMKSTPVIVDLTTLWEELGVSRSGRGVTLKADAPLAPIRRAMMGEGL